MPSDKVKCNPGFFINTQKFGALQGNCNLVLQTLSSNCAMLQEEYPVQEEDASLEIFSTLIMLKIQMLSQVNKNTEIYSFQHTRKIHYLTILFLSLY